MRVDEFYYVDIIGEDDNIKKISIEEGEALKKALLEGVQWFQLKGDVYKASTIKSVTKHKETILND